MTDAQKRTVGTIQKRHIGCSTAMRKHGNERVRLIVYTGVAIKTFEILLDGRSYRVA